MSGPQRIVCRPEEPTEVLYAIGEERRIVGISGFTVRPPRARKEKPKVSAFTSARIERIVALAPDLVLGFSGVPVHVFNQRSIAEILTTVGVVGGLIGCEAKAQALAERLASGVARVAAAG